MVLVIASICLLHVIGSFAVWRVAKFLCMPVAFLAWIPLVGFVYFMFVVDKLVIEAKSMKRSVFTIGVLVACLMCMVGVALNFLTVGAVPVITGRVLVLLGMCVFFIDTVMAYFMFLDEGLNCSMLCVFTSMIITPPIYMFIASLYIPGNLEEVIELYS